MIDNDFKIKSKHCDDVKRIFCRLKQNPSKYLIWATNEHNLSKNVSKWLIFLWKTQIQTN